MAGEGRTPSTRNARTSGQADSGTGQHPRTFTGTNTAPALKVPRVTSSPSKTGGSVETSKDRRDESSARSTTPPGGDAPVRMTRDSGEKTERERTFARINSEIRTKIDGTTDRSFYPSQLERQKGDYARDDKYSGSKPQYRPKQAQ